MTVFALKYDILGKPPCTKTRVTRSTAKTLQTNHKDMLSISACATLILADTSHSEYSAKSIISVTDLMHVIQPKCRMSQFHRMETKMQEHGLDFETDNETDRFLELLGTAIIQRLCFSDIHDKMLVIEGLFSTFQECYAQLYNGIRIAIATPKKDRKLSSLRNIYEYKVVLLKCKIQGQKPRFEGENPRF